MPPAAYVPPNSAGKPATLPTSPPSQGARTPTVSQRLLAALVGAVLGGIIGVLSGGWVGGLFAGPGWAVAGAIAGNRRTVIVTALVVAVVGWLMIISMVNRWGSFAVAGAVGTPLGAIMGAIATVIYLKLRRAPDAIATKSAVQK